VAANANASLVIEWRSAEGNEERLPGLATDWVNLNVDVIVAPNTSATSAAQKKATAIIPIVMGNVSDPVESGFVKSLARPTTTCRCERDLRLYS
jgi:putative ABC transport system substrate-binding protein